MSRKLTAEIEAEILRSSERGEPERQIAERLGLARSTVNNVRRRLSHLNASAECDCGRRKEITDEACDECSWRDGLSSKALSRMVSELLVLGGEATAKGLAKGLGVNESAVFRNWYRLKDTQDRVRMIPGSSFDPPVFVLNERRGR